MKELTATKYQGHQGPVLCLDVSVDDACLLSGSEDSTARLWDLRENNKRRASLCIQTHGEVLSVAFSPPPPLSSSLSSNTTTATTTIINEQVEGKEENNPAAVLKTFARDYSVYLSVENCVYEYDLRQATAPIIVNQPSRDLSPILQNQDEVNQLSLAYHIPKQPNSSNSSKKRKNNKSSKQQKQKQQQEQEQEPILYLAAADDAGTIRFMEASSTASSQVFRHDPNAVVTTCAFRPPQQTTSKTKKGPSSSIFEMVTGGTDCTVQLWDAYKPKRPLSSYSISTPETESGKPQVCNPPFIYSLGYSKSGNLLAAGLGDGNVNIFSFVDNRRRLLLTGLLPDGHDSSIASVLFPFETNDRVLYSGGSDGKILCWDLGRTVCNNATADSSSSSTTTTPTFTTDPTTLFSSSLLQTTTTTTTNDDDLIQQTETLLSLVVDKPKILFGLPHGNKINWMASTTTKTSSLQSTLFVADTTNDITAYSIPLQ